MTSASRGYAALIQQDAEKLQTRINEILTHSPSLRTSLERMIANSGPAVPVPQPRATAAPAPAAPTPPQLRGGKDVDG